MELPQEFAIATAPDGIGESTFEALPLPDELDSADFRRTLGMFATGVTVITTLVEDQIHGMTANAFMSVSLQPPLILISVDRRARMNSFLREDVRFGVSVLEEGQSALSDRFAGRPGEDFEPAFEIVDDTPLVDGALAHIAARVVRSYWGGDHSLFLGRAAYVRYGDGTPLLFHGGGYGRVLGNPRVFSALPPELLQAVLSLGTERTYEGGGAVMRAGGAGAFLAPILGGAAGLRRGGPRRAGAAGGRRRGR